MYGMIYKDGNEKPGDILQLWQLIRQEVGTVPKERKQGMKFDTLSAENVIDKVRDAADRHGVLVYPVMVQGVGHAIEDGTLADVTVTFNVQAISDGSYITIAGFGLGADSQDKAGGKAGTYAMKQALVQALLANGSTKKGGIGRKNAIAADTDDTDTPIEGGVKRSAPPAVDDVIALFDMAQTKEEFNAVMVKFKRVHPDNQIECKDSLLNAMTRLGIERKKKAE